MNATKLEVAFWANLILSNVATNEWVGLTHLVVALGIIMFQFYKHG